MIRAGVVGWPVDHSLSPKLHGYWLEKYSIDGEYVKIPVDPEDVEAGIRALAGRGFSGFNVTVPHKEAAFRLMDEVDAAAGRLRAVNTVTVGPDGRLHGANTDGFGFLENLKAGLGRPDLPDGPALVIGAGGAARAIVGALLDAGADDIRLANRTAARAERLAADLGGPVSIVDWEMRDKTLGDVALLINATSLGMAKSPTLEFSLAGLAPDAVVTDIVYAPLETPLLAAARARGHRTVDGLGMLLHQGRPGFERWFGVAPEVDGRLRSRMLEALGQ